MATIKQKLAFKKVVRGSTITQAMKDVHYAPSTAARTNKLTASKGFQELIDKHISEEALTKVHAQGLKATLTKFTPEGDLLKLPDYAVRHKYMETGYKVRGKLKNEEPGNTINILNVYSPEQLKRIAARVSNGEPEGAATSS